MVQPKYSPEEALQRVKLMMGYDTNKTLKENKEIIFEQENSCTNPIEYDELLDYVKQAEEAIDDVFNWAGSKDLMDSYEDAKDVYDALKAVSGKNIYDEESGKCVSAIEMFKTRYKEINSEDWVGGKESLEDGINDILKRNLGAESNRYARLALKLLSTATAVVPDGKKQAESGGKKDEKTNTGGGGKSQSPKIPSELKDIDGVKKFQDWLDKNKAGWATGFSGGVLNQAGGYGRFGPRTTKAWNSYGQEYLKGGTPKPEEKPEVAGEVQNISTLSTDF